MKSLLIALSIFAAAPVFAAYSSAYDSNGYDIERSPTVDYISWCDSNNVMMVQKDQIVILRNCTDEQKTCRVVTQYTGFRSQVTASCQ